MGVSSHNVDKGRCDARNCIGRVILNSSNKFKNGVQEDFLNTFYSKNQFDKHSKALELVYLCVEPLNEYGMEVKFVKAEKPVSQRNVLAPKTNQSVTVNVTFVIRVRIRYNQLLYWQCEPYVQLVKIFDVKYL